MKNIKKIGRWAFLVCSFSVIPHLMEAQVERKTMVVKLVGQSEGKVFFSLAEQPKYWIANNELFVQSASRAASYSLSSVDEISFSNEETDTEDITTSNVTIFPNPTQDYIRIAGLPRNAKVELIDASGAGLERFVVVNDQCFSILVANLPQGVYILKINEQSYKFIKK